MGHSPSHFNGTGNSLSFGDFSGELGSSTRSNFLGSSRSNRSLSPSMARAALPPMAHHSPRLPPGNLSKFSQMQPPTLEASSEKPMATAWAWASPTAKSTPPGMLTTDISSPATAATATATSAAGVAAPSENVRPQLTSSTSVAELEELEGPLWSSVKKQLYKPEVAHVKRMIGESLIQKNKALWEELHALRQIMADFERQNDEVSERQRKQMMLCGSQHRDLLRRQARILAEDIRAQAQAAGHVLEDLLPELRAGPLRNFLFADEEDEGNSVSDEMNMSGSSSRLRGFARSASGGGLDSRPGTAGCRSSPPMTPSTRPPSSCGRSGCSTPDVGFPTLPLGRALALEELRQVADGIREALEAEQESLLGLVGEQMQRFEWEDRRRLAASGQCSGPSTTELQALVKRMQDLAVSPSLRALTLAGSSPGDGYWPGDASMVESQPQAIAGGASVRRLKALIAQRRREAQIAPTSSLGIVPEFGGLSGKQLTDDLDNGGTVPTPDFDLFFSDPFE